MTAVGPCDLAFRAVVDVARIRGRVERRRTATPGEPEPACDGSLLWLTEGDLSQCGVALLTDGPDQADRETRDWDASGPLCTDYRLRAGRGQQVRFWQTAALVPSALHAHPDEEAVRRVARAGLTGFETLRRRNREAWAELWKGRIIVEGASQRHQALIDAAFFYLNTSPMLPALYCAWAAMAGDRDLALKLFEEGYAAYDSERFHQCLE